MVSSNSSAFDLQEALRDFEESPESLDIYSKVVELCQNHTISLDVTSNITCPPPVGLDPLGGIEYSQESVVPTPPLKVQPQNDDIDFVKIAVLSVIIILTIVGNVAVVLSIMIRRAKVTRMYFFILHLSIADILTALITLLSELIWTFTFPRFYGGNILCKAVRYGQALGPYLSSYTLVMTAIDRYQAICFPLSNYKWTIHRSHIMLAIAWIISILFSVPQTIVFREQNSFYCVPKYEANWGRKAYTTWHSTSNFFVPFLILLFCYVNMCTALWTNFKKKKQEQQQPQSQLPQQQRSSGVNDIEAVALNGHAVDHSLQDDACKKAPKKWSRNLRNLLRQKPSKEENNFLEMREILQQQTSLSADAQRKITTGVGADGDNPRSASVKLTMPSDSSSCIVESGPVARQESFPFKKSSSSRPSSLRSHPAQPRTSSVPALRPIASNLSQSRSQSPKAPPPAPPPNPSSSSIQCPRSHSIRTISNAKIKTVKLTIVVVLGYLVCSAPFVFVQLYTVWGDPGSQAMSYLSWLFWLYTLNSCLNPWIYMSFNRELVHTLFRFRYDNSSNCGANVIRMRRQCAAAAAAAAAAKGSAGGGHGSARRDGPGAADAVEQAPKSCIVMRRRDSPQSSYFVEMAPNMDSKSSRVKFLKGSNLLMSPNSATVITHIAETTMTTPIRTSPQIEISPAIAGQSNHIDRENI